jgi:hypothetical protein
MCLKDQGEIQTKKKQKNKIRKSKQKTGFCLDCRPKKFKTGEIQTKILVIQIKYVKSKQ